MVGCFTSGVCKIKTIGAKLLVCGGNRDKRKLNEI